jgi:hypothetical protein
MRNEASATHVGAWHGSTLLSMVAEPFSDNIFLSGDPSYLQTENAVRAALYSI